MFGRICCTGGVKMNSGSKVLCAAALFTLVVGVPSLWAQWITDGVPVCTAAGDQEVPQITTDGSGGAIFTWSDYRAGNWSSMPSPSMPRARGRGERTG
jgi:hypothetical protein